jgi:IS30 family transposase
VIFVQFIKESRRAVDKQEYYRWLNYFRYLWLRPVPDKKATTIANTLYEMYLAEIPDVPEILQCDNGGEFQGATKILMQKLGVKIVHGRPYAPHVQGKVSKTDNSNHKP